MTFPSYKWLELRFNCRATTAKIARIVELTWRPDHEQIATAPIGRCRTGTMDVIVASCMTALAQDSEGSSSPAGLAMLVLFLGIAGIVGVFVIRWSQSTPDDEE